MELEVVLDKQPPDIRPVILAKGGWEPGTRIEPTPFVVRRIIEEIPDVEKVVAGNTATGTVLQVKQARDVTAKLNGVTSNDFRSHVLVTVGPLIEDAANVRSKCLYCRRTS